jgi:condensin complex subunit 3
MLCLTDAPWSRIHRESDGVKPDETIQVDLALKMVKALYKQEASTPSSFPPLSRPYQLTNLATPLFYRAEDARKLWCQLLPKLYIPEEADDYSIKALLELISALKDVRPLPLPFPPFPPLLTLTFRQNRPLTDSVPRNALNRFETSLTKTFGARIEALSEEEVEASEKVKGVREWLEAVDADSEEEEDEEEGEEDDDEEEESEDEEEDEE